MLYKYLRTRWSVFSRSRVCSTVVVRSGLVTTHPLKADLQSLRDKFDTLIVDAQWYCGSHPLNSPRENLRLIGTLWSSQVYTVLRCTMLMLRHRMLCQGSKCLSDCVKKNYWCDVGESGWFEKWHLVLVDCSDSRVLPGNETCPMGLVTYESGVVRVCWWILIQWLSCTAWNETCPLGLVTNEPGVYTSVL